MGFLNDEGKGAVPGDSRLRFPRAGPGFVFFTRLAECGHTSRGGVEVPHSAPDPAVLAGLGIVGSRGSGRKLSADGK